MTLVLFAATDSLQCAALHTSVCTQRSTFWQQLLPRHKKLTTQYCDKPRQTVVITLNSIYLNDVNSLNTSLQDTQLNNWQLPVTTLHRDIYWTFAL